MNYPFIYGYLKTALDTTLPGRLQAIRILLAFDPAHDDRALTMLDEVIAEMKELPAKAVEESKALDSPTD